MNSAEWSDIKGSVETSIATDVENSDETIDYFSLLTSRLVFTFLYIT